MNIKCLLLLCCLLNTGVSSSKETFQSLRETCNLLAWENSLVLRIAGLMGLSTLLLCLAYKWRYKKAEKQAEMPMADEATAENQQETKQPVKRDSFDPNLYRPDY